MASVNINDIPQAFVKADEERGRTEWQRLDTYGVAIHSNTQWAVKVYKFSDHCA